MGSDDSLVAVLCRDRARKLPGCHISIAVFDVGSQFDEIDDGNQLQLFDL